MKLYFFTDELLFEDVIKSRYRHNLYEQTIKVVFQGNFVSL